MARVAQLTFEQRIARIEQKVAARSNPNRRNYPKGALMRTSRKQRRVYWDALVFGVMIGGGIGTLFAMNVGLLPISEMSLVELQNFMLKDHVRAALVGGVAVAPVGFVLSQMFARSMPRFWQFWIGYLAAVLGTNSTDIQLYAESLARAAG